MSRLQMGLQGFSRLQLSSQDGDVIQRSWFQDHSVLGTIISFRPLRPFRPLVVFSSFISFSTGDFGVFRQSHCWGSYVTTQTVMMITVLYLQKNVLLKPIQLLLLRFYFGRHWGQRPRQAARTRNAACHSAYGRQSQLSLWCSPAP